jgi:hypothetical protein
MQRIEGSVRIVFPVPPMWIPVLTITMSAVAGCAEAALGIWIVFSMHRLASQFHLPKGTPVPFMFPTRLYVVILSVRGLAALFWWSAAGFSYWTLRRWGRVPRVLTASAHGLSESRLGWFRMRERKWLAADIASIEVRPIWGNLTRHRTVSWLFMNRHNGRRLRFRLSSRDPLLPREIANQIATAIEVPAIGTCPAQ